MTSNLKATLGVMAAVLAVIVGVVVFGGRGGGESVSDTDALVRPDSHRISEAHDGKVTVVEFLDFECESCGAAYPAVEQLRAAYAGKITYVVRYFPIDSHPNAHNAARAAQAAAAQGEFEAMYKKLFDNQTRWGHRQQSQAAVFERYAAELGLDVERFRADVASDATAARIRADQEDGMTLGVQGTPTFFVNGERFRGGSLEVLTAAVDAALGK
jgi:protein-disulfide isomerase